MENLSTLTLYQNTPITDLNNTIHFTDNRTRDNFFDTHYKQKSIPNVNLIRDRLTLRIPANIADFSFCSEVNYLRFDWEGTLYYCMVMEAKYNNQGMTELYCVVDGLMTFGQGDWVTGVNNVRVDRQHLPANIKKANMDFLRTNGDIIQANDRKVVKTETFKWDGMQVVFLSKYDLSADFGNEDKPKMVRSNGQTFDQITSPLNLYVVERGDFTDLMDVLKNYSWVADNITKVTIIPTYFVSGTSTEDVIMKTGSFKKLKKFKNNAKAGTVPMPENIKFPKSRLMELLALKDETLLNSNYLNIEVMNFQGAPVTFKPEFLKDDNFSLTGDTVVGYNNAAYFYDKGYKGNVYINNALAFTNWDTVPVMVDQGQLAISKGANQRALAENNLISGQVGNLMGQNGASLEDRFMAGAGLLSAVNPLAVGGKIKDEYDFYRKQKAEFEDARLASPSVGDQIMSNSFVYKHGRFGVTVQISMVDWETRLEAQNYHAHFGYQWGRQRRPYSIESMPVMNYLKMSGNWYLPDRHIPQSILTQMRVQLEAGVKFWHNNGKDNPMGQDLYSTNVL